jgi:hypothetical protein
MSGLSTTNGYHEPGQVTVVQWGAGRKERRRKKYKIHPKAWLALEEAGPRGTTAEYLTHMTDTIYKTTSSWLSQIYKLGFTFMVEKRGVPTRYFLLPENQWKKPLTEDLFMYRQYPLDLPEPS